MCKINSTGDIWLSYMAFLHDTHTVTIYDKCAEEVLNYDQTEYTRTLTMLCECIVCKQPATDVL